MKLDKHDAQHVLDVIKRNGKRRQKRKAMDFEQPGLNNFQWGYTIYYDIDEVAFRKCMKFMW